MLIGVKVPERYLLDEADFTETPKRPLVCFCVGRAYATAQAMHVYAWAYLLLKEL
jgi:hypothetical protein